MISSSQVKIDELSKYHPVTVASYITNQKTYWLKDFIDYKSQYHFSVAVQRAMEFLESVDSGVVHAPETCIDNATLLKYPTTLIKTVGKINVEYYNNRYPINSESRPLLGTEFEVGDKVINTDIITNTCIGWICIEGGIPGVWREFGQIRKHYTEVQSMSYLPQASELQLGRQVLLTNDEKSTSSLWICKKNNGEYSWCQQDYDIGDTDSRPETPSIGYIRYNTQLKTIEWWNGFAWDKVPNAEELDKYVVESKVLAMIQKFSLPSDLGSISSTPESSTSDVYEIGSY